MFNEWMFIIELLKPVSQSPCTALFQYSRHFPVVRAAQEGYQWPLRNGEHSHRSREPQCIATEAISYVSLSKFHGNLKNKEVDVQGSWSGTDQWQKILQPSGGKHIEAETKWPQFCRRHFQTYFLVWKLLYFDWNFTEMCFQSSN